MKIKLDYIPPNWNEYINKERSSKFSANDIKKRELEEVRYATVGIRYKGKYPIRLIITKHFKDYRQDLDNCRYKGILDGLVKCGVIKNDNLKHIQEIVLKSKIDGQEYMELELEEL